MLKYCEMLMSKERKGLHERTHERLRPAMSHASPDEAVALNFIAGGPIQFFDLTSIVLTYGRAKPLTPISSSDSGGWVGSSPSDPAAEFPKIKCPVLITFFTVSAWDSNCPQHIPQRLEAAEVKGMLAERDKRIEELTAELDQLRKVRTTSP